jgi:hypothetical protein
MRRLTCLAALACCCSAPLPARADTITISGGALTAVGIFGFTSFTLTGEGFEVVGGREPGGVGPAGSCFPCVAGDPINFDSRFVGEFTLGSGPAIVDGVSYAKLWYTGVLAFDGETMAFPGRSSSVDLTSPFSLVSEGFWVSVRSSRGISQSHTPASHVGCPRQSAALDGAVPPHGRHAIQKSIRAVASSDSAHFSPRPCPTACVPRHPNSRLRSKPLYSDTVGDRRSAMLHRKLQRPHTSHTLPISTPDDR